MQLLSDFIENLSKPSFRQEKCLSFETKKIKNLDRNDTLKCKNILFDSDHINFKFNLNTSKWSTESHQLDIFNWLIFIFLFLS